MPFQGRALTEPHVLTETLFLLQRHMLTCTTQSVRGHAGISEGQAQMNNSLLLLSHPPRSLHWGCASETGAGRWSCWNSPATAYWGCIWLCKKNYEQKCLIKGGGDYCGVLCCKTWLGKSAWQGTAPKISGNCSSPSVEMVCMLAWRKTAVMVQESRTDSSLTSKGWSIMGWTCLLVVPGHGVPCKNHELLCADQQTVPNSMLSQGTGSCSRSGHLRL